MASDKILGMVPLKDDLKIRSNLNQLEYFPRPFTFKLNYLDGSGLSVGHVIWRQTSNPVVASTVEGFEVLENKLLKSSR